MPVNTLLAAPDDPEPLRSSLLDTVIPRRDGVTFRVGQHVQVAAEDGPRHGQIVPHWESQPFDGNSFRIGPPPSTENPHPAFDSYAYVAFDDGSRPGLLSTSLLSDDPDW
ncbi:hypothetical protein FRAHR75_770017 [Frankia sp. Hr75.2]|nr:hypothetical protein FRAHR75_770017 [Frankia sp. Hr75.2]